MAVRLVAVRMAHLIAGLAFASHHTVVLSQFFPMGWAVGFGLAVGLGGMFWSYLYRRQGTLLGCWISHMAADFAIMAIGARAIGLM